MKKNLPALLVTVGIKVGSCFCFPGDSKGPFDHLVGGHLTFERVT